MKQKMVLTTHKFRIKDTTTRNKLMDCGKSVNYVWNYCNEVSKARHSYNGQFLSSFDLNKLTSGTSKSLNLPSPSIQGTCEAFVKSRKQFKKISLKWRSNKKSLGWIPFKSSSIKILGFGKLKFNGNTYRFWQTCDIGVVRCGSFNQDSKGRWYVNMVVEDTGVDKLKTGVNVGVDLGLKTVATYSDGSSFDPVSATRLYADKLAAAQRARKKKQVASIQAKIKNTRKDALQKETTRVVNTYDKIFVGDVSSTKLAKTKMAKSVLDAGWGLYRSMLAYKAIRLGKEVVNVKENYSTVTCSNCFKRTGPSGLSALGVREWVCECGAVHNRDVNAAKNILRFGHETLKEESGQIAGRCQSCSFSYCII